MGLSSTITNDIVGQTSTLTILSNNVQIEQIVFTSSNDNLSFSTELAFTLSPSDFINFATILDKWNDALPALFKIAPFYKTLFTCTSISLTDDNVSTIAFSYSKTSHPLYSITAIYPNGVVSFDHRNQPSTITYQEWLLYHATSNTYEQGIRARYGI